VGAILAPSSLANCRCQELNIVIYDCVHVCIQAHRVAQNKVERFTFDFLLQASCTHSMHNTSYLCSDTDAKS